MEELRIKREQINRVILHGGEKRLTAKQVYAGLLDKPDYLINGLMYDMKSGITVADTVVNGVLVNGGNYTNKGIAVNDNDLVQCTTIQAKTLAFNSFFGGSPNLMTNGIVDIDCKGFDTWFITKGKSDRLAMGFNEQELIFCFPKEKMTIMELADDMVSTGCQTAINLDGGGSRSVIKVVDGQLVYLNNPTENRANSTWILIYLKKDGGKKMKVVLDAGHSKETAGKRAFDYSFFEYVFNRQVAVKVSEHLKRHGVDVILTAPTDKEVSLQDRCAISNKIKPDCFVSIHANAFGITWNDANGWEIYIVGQGGKAEKLANCIKKHSLPYLGLKDRGVKVSDFFVLKNTDAPAVLIEHGFYTNKEELAKLKTEAFVNKCAIADSKGILEHLGIKWEEEVAMPDNGVSSWAKDAQEWVMAERISDGTRPRDQVTREEVWQMLMQMGK